MLGKNISILIDYATDSTGGATTIEAQYYTSSRTIPSPRYPSTTRLRTPATEALDYCGPESKTVCAPTVVHVAPVYGYGRVVLCCDLLRHCVHSAERGLECLAQARMHGELAARAGGPAELGARHPARLEGPL